VVGGDPVQPGRQLGVAPERVDRLEDGDEHLLGHILGLLPVAEHPVGEVVDPVAVLLEQLAEGLLVALA
jgi:hypothetical protein